MMEAEGRDMKEIRNLTRRPIRVPLGGGKVLHLGPAAAGQVADDAVERPAFRKLVDAGEIEVLGEGHVDSAGDRSSSSPRESTQGHQQRKVMTTKGNRGA